jgi:hypothetical protein
MKLRYLFVLLLFSILMNAQNSFEIKDAKKQLFPLSLLPI